MGPEIRNRPLPADDRAGIPGADLAAWRRERLLRAGVEPELAASIAADCATDLHAFIELVERGCPPGLAARILAPLDHEQSPC